MSIVSPGDKVIGMGGSFGLDQQIKQEVLKDVMAYMKAIMSSFKGRDQRLLGMLSDFPPPPVLVSSKSWLLFRMRIAKSESLKRLLASIIINIINPNLDLFDQRQVILENIFEPNIGRKARKIIPTSDITALQEGRVDKDMDPVEVLSDTGKDTKYDERLEKAIEGFSSLDDDSSPLGPMM